MQLSFSGIAFILGLALGGFVAYKFLPTPDPITLQVTKTKVKTVRVTEPNGTVREETVSDSSNEQKPAQKKRYGVGLYHDKAMFVEARLGDLPLFLIGETNLREHRVGIKLEF